MEIKKYTICPSFEMVMNNLNTINKLLILDDREMIIPQPVTGYISEGGIKTKTNKWFYINPAEKYIGDSNHFEQTDINPNKTPLVYYNIYKFMNSDNEKVFTDWTIPPHSLDYKLGLNIKLHGDYKFDLNGNLVECIYYEKVERDMNSNITYSNPIIKYTAEYYHDNDGYCTHRIVNRDWMLSNGEWGGVLKTTRKEYTRLQARDISIVRRKSLISKTIVDVGGLVLLTEQSVTTIREAEMFALELIIDVSNEMSAYYEYGTLKYNNEAFPLQKKIMESTISWLDNDITGIIQGFDNKTIRDYILFKITQAPI